MNDRKTLRSLILVIVLALLVFNMPVTALRVSAEEGPDPNFHIYLAFGESNMDGQGASVFYDTRGVLSRRNAHRQGV